MVLLYSSPDLVSGASYTLSRNGTLSDYTSSWLVLYTGDKWSSGTKISSFTTSSTVTVINSR